MNLIKTSFWSAVSTTAKILAGVITTKIIAIYLGPVGVAFLGNFANITSIMTTFSNGAIGSGVTKYISEFEIVEEKKKVISQAIKINLTCSFIIGIVVIILHNYLAKLAFGDLKYNMAFIVFGYTVIFFGLNTTIAAVLNGYRHIKIIVATGIIGSVISVILAVIITIKFGIMGALLNSSIAQICIFMVNVLFIRKMRLFNFKMIIASIDFTLLRKLLKYSTMNIVSILVVPTSSLIIRKYIFNNFSPNEAGYLQSVWGISAMYLAIVTTTLSIYYLPTLSSIKDNFSLRKEILNGYKLLLPMAIIGGIFIYICRDLIIYLLYTPEFLPMKEYFTFQIIGDTLKIASWLLGYLMIAKAMTRWFIISEIIFSSLYLVLSFLFMHFFGSIGVTYAYALNYFVFLIFVIIIFRKLVFSNRMVSK